ncbi:MAG: hypothetical protein HC850_14320 [Rhodomicrobium sp.]|nr:hypothetical protein [Rhodomicrobium sp.]
MILVDADSDHSTRGTATVDLRAAAQRMDTQVVILGSLSRSEHVVGDQFVAKPYHYGPLIRKIEDLLAAA